MAHRRIQIRGGVLRYPLNYVMDSQFCLWHVNYLLSYFVRRGHIHLAPGKPGGFLVA